MRSPCPACLPWHGGAICPRKCTITMSVVSTLSVLCMGLAVTVAARQAARCGKRQSWGCAIDNVELMDRIDGEGVDTPRPYGRIAWGVWWIGVRWSKLTQMVGGGSIARHVALPLHMRRVSAAWYSRAWRLRRVTRKLTHTGSTRKNARSDRSVSQSTLRLCCGPFTKNLRASGRNILPFSQRGARPPELFPVTRCRSASNAPKRAIVAASTR